MLQNWTLPNRWGCKIFACLVYVAVAGSVRSFGGEIISAFWELFGWPDHALTAWYLTLELTIANAEESVRGDFKQNCPVLEASGSYSPSDTISNYKKMSGNMKSLRQIIIIWSSPCLIFSELTLRHSKLAEEKEKEDSHQDQGKGEQQPGEHFKRSPEGGTCQVLSSN